jgi:hypothetical protein
LRKAAGFDARAYVRESRSHLNGVKVTQIQDLGIQARVASVIGAKVFDQVFAGIKFAEVDGPLLCVYARDAPCAAEIEDEFSFMIADIASWILQREVELVVVLSKIL